MRRIACAQPATAAHDGVMKDQPRFPRSVYAHGEDPDPRFSLANERTFLAWIRTSLGLVAAGVALEVLPVEVRQPFGMITAVALILLGVSSAVHAWFAWCRTERALRENRSLPGPAFSLAVVVVAVLVGVALVVDLVR